MSANDINLENGLGQKVYWPHMQMTFGPERQPLSSSWSLTLFLVPLLLARHHRQLKLKTYLPPFRCISCRRRHTLRMSNVCFSSIARGTKFFCAFHCAGIINANRKANMWKYAPYQLLAPNPYPAPRAAIAALISQAAWQSGSVAACEQARLEACCLHSRC